MIIAIIKCIKNDLQKKIEHNGASYAVRSTRITIKISLFCTCTWILEGRRNYVLLDYTAMTSCERSTKEECKLSEPKDLSALNVNCCG